jgi:hypothetical protein
MYGAQYLQIAQEMESSLSEESVDMESLPGVLTEAEIERLPSYK